MKLLNFNPKKSKAQAMVEFAIVLPILLLVVYGLIETGRLIFIVASVNNAARQAARYGSTSGVGPNGLPRYQDCNGIRAAAQNVDFMNTFDDVDIAIEYDQPTAGNSDPTPYDTCGAGAVAGNSAVTGDRISVSIAAAFNPILPNFLPFLQRTINAKSSRTLLLTISIEPPKEQTITIITTDSPDPSEIGAWVTVSVEVTGTDTIPTGTVAIAGADVDCSITLVDGAGSCNVRFTTTTPPTRTLTASYAGDDTHYGSSDTENHTVVPASTDTIITADTPDPSLVGGTVIVSVDVTSSWGTPNGTVDITGADTNCTITLSSGTGTCNVNFLSNGTKTLTATYTGNVTFDTSSDTESHEVIIPGTTVTTIISDAPDSSGVGQPVTVSVAVTSATTPTGTVAITGADTNCSFTLSGGTGSCNVVFNSLGNKTITATYTPDTPLFFGSSATEAHTVSLPGPTLTITDTPDPSSAGQSVTITVTVAGGSTTPTGTVAITGADTNCTITLSGGTGSCTVIFNTSGSKTLTATYSGDGTHGTTSKTEPHTVSIVAQPVAACDTLPSATNPSKLNMIGGNLVINITNPFGVELQISAIKITWNHDKGHQTGTDKTIRLQSTSLAGIFWNGNELGPDAIILPMSPAPISANSTSALSFIFHQTFDRWDNTESVEIFFANPGCETVSLKQTLHE